jgi:diguanylate cyclase (GGDEF)-like protein
MTVPQPIPAPRRPGTGRFTRPSMTFPVKVSWWQELWRSPVAALVSAGADGEMLVARARLVLTVLAVVIPVLEGFRHPGSRATSVGLVAEILGVAAALIAYRALRKRGYQPGFGFITSVLDVTLVSGVLCAFLVLQQPVVAVNGLAVFSLYFLAIAASALRFDPRICVVAGAAAVIEYVGIILAAAAGGAAGFSWTDQIFRLVLLAAVGVLCTTLVWRTRELQSLAARDKLTGLLNRGIFDDLLHDATLRARRYGRPLSILMLDVDQFKRFNDTWGHAAGDEALKAVAAAIKQSVRQGEIVARYGGDEFVVLFPETRPDIAVSRGDKIRLRVPPIVAGGRGREQTIPVTVSVGVASLPADGIDGFEVLNQADMRLYEAKHAGRNAVVGPAAADTPPAAQAEGR